ncbi:MAG: VanZ family protein [Candidatus Neomarinimicrobiota bacterium]
MKRQLLPAVLYGTLIVAFSSVPGKNFPDIKWLAYDKFIHLAQYAIFGVLVYQAAHSLRPGRRFLLGLVVLLAGGFGALDELYQLLIPARDSSFGDWVADIVGVVLGAISCRWWINRRDQATIH